MFHLDSSASIIKYKCIEKHNEVKNSQVEIFSCIHEKQLQFLPAVFHRVRVGR